METLTAMTARFRLLELLEEAGMSQTDLARSSGISMVTINRMCANKTAQVALKTLDAIANVLRVDPGDLIEGEKGAKKRRGRG